MLALYENINNIFIKQLLPGGGGGGYDGTDDGPPSEAGIADTPNTSSKDSRRRRPTRSKLASSALAQSCSTTGEGGRQGGEKSTDKSRARIAQHSRKQQRTKRVKGAVEARWALRVLVLFPHSAAETNGANETILEAPLKERRVAE